MIMKDCDFIWVVSGLGGGTGSLGSLQVISILSRLGKPHGLICTLPCLDEGTTEKVNALISMKAIQDAHEKSDSFRSILIIDNNILKEKIIGQFSYEKFWSAANDIICGGIINMYEYSKKESITSFDSEDYLRIIMEKGCIIFSKEEFEFKSTDTETVLASKVKDMWNDNIFLCCWCCFNY